MATAENKLLPSDSKTGYPKPARMGGDLIAQKIKKLGIGKTRSKYLKKYQTKFIGKILQVWPKPGKH